MAVIVAYGFASFGLGAEQKAAGAGEHEVAGPYCGLYCVYAIAQNYRRPSEFEQLLDEKYLSSFEGSHIGQLREAADSLGLAALPLYGLTLGDLRTSTVPVVLLLSRPRQAGTFKHWVLLTRVQADTFSIMEAPGNIEQVSGAELLSQWNGVGLMVFPDHGAKRAFAHRLWVWKWLTGVVAAGAIVLLSLAVCRLRIASFHNTSRFVAGPWRHALLITAFAVLAAGLWHGLAETGFFRNPAAVGFVQYNYFSRTLPSVETREVALGLKNRDIVVIDSRLPDAYAAGHIPGSVNLPLYVTQSGLREFAEQLPRQGRVVVYCEGEGCPWDDEMGTRLQFMGVKNVVVYSGGWKKWTQDSVESER